MRILSIRLVNLNSLEGGWDINLEDAEFSANGIFAITGPTGSGKTTILDAVCLALYGQTPRLGKVTQTSNEIMSRHSGECMAEVTFEVSGKRFRASWMQSKARKKVDGALQPARHKLFDGEGQTIADKTKEVVREIEQLTGMDFERFTQSMLLAQGRFAAFLQADGDKRAPLLEQITGTAVYSRISQHIHERNREELLHLKALDDSLAGFRPLSDIEEKELRESCRHQQALCAELERQEAGIRARLAILDKAEELEQQEAELKAQAEGYKNACIAFQPELERLCKARQAQSLSGHHEKLVLQREELAKDRSEEARLTALLPELLKQEEGAECAAGKARQELLQQKEAVAALRDVLKNVRELDTKLASASKELDTENNELTSASSSLEALKKNRSEQCARLHAYQDSLSTLKAQLEARGCDARLAELLPVLEARLEHLQKNVARQAMRLSAIAENDKALACLSEKASAQQQEIEKLASQEEQLQHRIKTAEQHRSAVLGGSSVGGLRMQSDRLKERRRTLDRLLEMIARQTALARQCEEAARQRIEFKESIIRAQETLAQKKNIRSALLRETELLQEAIALQDKILGYDAERRRLIEGQPCPLCGSTSHPYALEGLPASDEKRDRLATALQDIQRLDTELEALVASIAEWKSGLRHSELLISENDAEQDALSASFLSAFSSLSPALAATLTASALSEEDAIALTAQERLLLSAFASRDEAALLAALQDDASQTDSSISTLEERLVQLENIDEGLNDLRIAFARLHENTERSLSEVSKLEHQTELRIADASRLRGEAEQDRIAEDAGRDSMRQMLLPFGITAESQTELEAALSDLIRRRDRYAELLRKEKEFSDDHAALEKQADITAERLAAAEKALALHAQRHGELSEACALLLERRTSLFGTRDADGEEKQAERRLAELEKQERDAHILLENVRRRAELESARLEECQKRKVRHIESLRELEETFRELLEKTGFPDEHACMSSLLPEEMFKSLEQRNRKLADTGAALEAAEEALKKRRAALPDLPEEPRHELLSSLESLSTQRSESLQTMGSLQQRLQSNEKTKTEAGKALELRDRQEKACRRWKELDELIGSADGKKFRNFAQSLTFRRLLLMANRQLASMTDRYTLVHNTDEPLALDVIDRYQADLKRSSRSLSGGESFMVSLALALGLAQMASRNVSVDSVFLDEGFGTLDEEALNTALDMLSSLRRKGKLIGIISHMQVIQDRVGTQIHVEPAGGGRSRLFGPGITHGKA